MCCFSGPVRWVGATRIFARRTRPGHQLVVYGMGLESASDVAMILPLPVARSAGEAALRFIDLSPWPTFFDELDGAFPTITGQAFEPLRAQSSRAPLAVHAVGAYVASFVPTLGDFSRLDRRFRMPAGVWEALPGYREFGFAVFQLRGATGPRRWPWSRPPAARQAVHPMAFELATAVPDDLFFPTVHVHDGAVHTDADFDHTLYAQGVDGAPWVPSRGPLGEALTGRVPDLVDLAAPGVKRLLRGRMPNRDIVVPLA